MWEVIFNHSAYLVATYVRHDCLGEAGTPFSKDPREGFAFGSTADQPHSRGYAKSLIWGFATNKAAKALKGLQDEYADALDKAWREKIAIAILKDCKLVKGDSEAIKASLNKVEPKRERAIAEAVLAELKKSTKKPTTTSGGKNTKKSTTKGGSKGKSSKPTTKGGKKSPKAAK